MEDIYKVVQNHTQLNIANIEDVNCGIKGDKL